MRQLCATSNDWILFHVMLGPEDTKQYMKYNIIIQ